MAGGSVLGGAISNLLDRFFREGSGFLGGRVVDFIDPQWYPVFNVADACVVIGGILLVVVGALEHAEAPDRRSLRDRPSRSLPRSRASDSIASWQRSPG